MINKKFILGTVQLGLDYGINNHFGKPSKEAAFEILKMAYESNILYLDTAAAYGDSEQVIGEFHKKQGNIFGICTKLIIEDDDIERISDIIDSAIKRLQIEKIDVLYFHRFEQAKNDIIIQKIVEAKKQKKIDKIGISIYEPTELEYILDNLCGVVEVIQIPYNILDSVRWDSLIEKCHKANLEIYGRSVYLQGLLFKNDDDAFIRKMQAQEYVAYVKHYAEKKRVTIAQLLMDYCKKSNLDGIVIGCESVQQLKDNLEVWRTESCLNDDDVQIIKDHSKKIPIEIIDPRRW